MNFLKSGWNSVIGSSEPAPQPTVADTIEKLIERVETSTLLEDRRDACRTLKSLSKSYRLEVGAQGMNALINVLKTDTMDTEIVSYTLDTLCNVISGAQDDLNDYEGIQSPTEETEDIGIQFTEIFAKKKENVAILIDLLEEHDFKVRWPALKLLMGLLRNKLRHIQDAVLDKPSGISHLIDLLADSREIIRNDAILLLVHLTRGNAIIQKIVTFENAFDRLFEIMASEGFSEGGVVVEDCLIVCQNLLKNNASNQILFKEGSYIQKLMPFLDVLQDTSMWSAQKETNVLFLLQVIRSLVSPTNSSSSNAPVQKIMFQCGLFERLCDFFLAKGIPPEILSETINTVAEVIRGENHNQKHFSSLNAPVNPPKPLLVIFLLSMIDEKQSFTLRCAILYCFQCFLYKNEFGHAQVIETLLPNSAESSDKEITIGQLLCGGMFSNDSISHWFSTVALSHTLIDNKTQKEQLLRVQLAAETNNSPISLLFNCCTILQQTTKFHTKIGILMLLCTWLSNCSLAVVHFLQMPTNIPYLTSQVALIEGEESEQLIQSMCAFLLGICIRFNDDSVTSFTKEDLVQLIAKRIGVDSYIDKLGGVCSHETYSMSSQRPQIRAKRIDELVYDYEFCRLFKTMESEIVRAVQMKPTDLSNGPESNMNSEQHALVDKYKKLIREQDEEITKLRQEQDIIKHQLIAAEKELNELRSNCDQLRDQQALMKVTNSGYLNPPLDVYSASGYSDSENLRNQNNNLQERIRGLEAEISKLRSVQLNEIDQIILSVQQYGNLDFAASQFQRLQQDQFARLPLDLQQHIYYHQQQPFSDTYQLQQGYHQLNSSNHYSGHILQQTPHRMENQLLDSQPAIRKTQYDYYQTVNSQESQSTPNASPHLLGGDNFQNPEASLVPLHNDSLSNADEFQTEQSSPPDNVFLGAMSTETSPPLVQEVNILQNKLDAVDLQQSSFLPTSLQTLEPAQPYNQHHKLNHNN